MMFFFTCLGSSPIWPTMHVFMVPYNLVRLSVLQSGRDLVSFDTRSMRGSVRLQDGLFACVPHTLFNFFHEPCSSRRRISMSTHKGFGNIRGATSRSPGESFAWHSIIQVTVMGLFYVRPTLPFNFTATF